MDTKELGDFGEKIAKKFLEEKGYRILDTNFKRKWGEIDIVAQKDKNIIFVEVKTLKSFKTENKYFFPEDRIDWKKKKQLRKITQIYLSENKISSDQSYQIDIIGVEISPDFKKTKIKHYENAVEDDY